VTGHWLGYTRAMSDDAQPRWVDSHAHLTMFEKHEVAEVLHRADLAGVGQVLVPATSAEDLETAVTLALEHAGRVVAAAGVHPHDARTLNDELKRRIASALDREGVVAVGEIGLDYHYMNSPREDQLRALAWQLDLAVERDLPVIIHNRESWHDVEPALARLAGRLRGVCHSFCEGPEAARRTVELGLFVGISGMVTFRSAEEVRASARAVGPQRLLVETDSPYLAPVPRRGRRNEPAYVVHVAHRLADELGVSGQQLAETTTANFRSLFGG